MSLDRYTGPVLEDQPPPPVEPLVLDLTDFREFAGQAFYQAGVPSGHVLACETSFGPALLVRWHGRIVQCVFKERDTIPINLVPVKMDRQLTGS